MTFHKNINPQLKKEIEKGLEKNFQTKNITNIDIKISKNNNEKLIISTYDCDTDNINTEKIENLATDINAEYLGRSIINKKLQLFFKLNK
jgi:sugar-specific transcriptional regulator TrmB